jgi:hypothetical protein
MAIDALGDNDNPGLVRAPVTAHGGIDGDDRPDQFRGRLDAVIVDPPWPPQAAREVVEDLAFEFLAAHPRPLVLSV